MKHGSVFLVHLIKLCWGQRIPRREEKYIIDKIEEANWSALRMRWRCQKHREIIYA